jgi:hypothetical protein
LREPFGELLVFVIWPRRVSFRSCSHGDISRIPTKYPRPSNRLLKNSNQDATFWIGTVFNLLR